MHLHAYSMLHCYTCLTCTPAASHTTSRFVIHTLPGFTPARCTRLLPPRTLYLLTLPPASSLVLLFSPFPAALYHTVLVFDFLLIGHLCHCWLHRLHPAAHCSFSSATAHLLSLSFLEFLPLSSLPLTATVWFAACYLGQFFVLRLLRFGSCSHMVHFCHLSLHIPYASFLGHVWMELPTPSAPLTLLPAVHAALSCSHRLPLLISPCYRTQDSPACTSPALSTTFPCMWHGSGRTCRATPDLPHLPWDSLPGCDSGLGCCPTGFPCLPRLPASADRAFFFCLLIRCATPPLALPPACLHSACCTPAEPAFHCLQVGWILLCACCMVFCRYSG